MDRRTFVKGAALFSVVGAGAGISNVVSAAAPRQIRLDYAYYSPSSLVLKRFGWLEEQVKASGTQISWTLSQGSNRALEYLNSGSIDFGSTAGLAALLARANGNPIRSVYVYSQPEWTALAVAKNSPITKVSDLRGKKVAATKGTDPFLFLLRALEAHGVRKSDVDIVHLQHPDGRAALESGRVDAWAGLDPHLAASELQAGTRLIYRNVSFNTYGFLNVSEAFASRHPEQVNLVLAAYERARQWILDNPQQAAEIQAEEAKIPLDVAKLQLERTNFANPVIGTEHVNALQHAAPILLQEGLVKPGTNLNAVVAQLIDPSFAQALSPGQKTASR